jgi:Calx-beta domain-containing protein
MWLELGTDGYLYVTGRASTTSLNETILRFNATTGSFVDSFALGRDGWSFNLGPGNIVYGSSNSSGGFIDRYGPSSIEAFTVSLNSTSTSPVTVNYATADGTALAGTNYVAASGTLTFPAGVTTQTILIQTLDDGVADPTGSFTVTLSNPVGATIARGQGSGSIVDGDSTKFYVADTAGPASTYRYRISGTAFGNSALAGADTAPRGIASNATGATQWVVDANKNVYVYGPGGSLLGSWSAGGLVGSAQLSGIATNGTDIWLVDAKQHKVYKYTGAAGRTSGSQNAASSFSLNTSDSNPQDIVTDGTSLWVVDGTSLKVFKYTLSGSLLGSWSIDPADTHPTGITINPNNVSDVWIVDNGTDMVYQYLGAASRTSGSQNAGATFALAAGNTNPQGIADPPTADMLLATAAISSSSNGEGTTAPSSLNIPSSGIPSSSSPLSIADQLFANFARILSDATNIYQAELSSVTAMWQSADAVVMQHLDALLSMEAGAMGMSKDTLMRDLLFASPSSPNGV